MPACQSSYAGRLDLNGAGVIQAQDAQILYYHITLRQALLGDPADALTNARALLGR